MAVLTAMEDNLAMFSDDSSLPLPSWCRVVFLRGAGAPLGPPDRWYLHVANDDVPGESWGQSVIPEKATPEMLRHCLDCLCQRIAQIALSRKNNRKGA